MGNIKKLDAHVSNQIAAGEVVERPVSVVKELVENSLDAGATNIEVRIKNGGLSQIMVKDDGKGMDESDARQSINRYATSKLAHIHDLDHIASFGFRGEALPSIASISNMQIVTRQKNELHGIKLFIQAGKVESISKTGADYGTSVVVNDLFFNVPARLKFIKSKRYEYAAIDKLLRAFSFLHKDIGFRFFSDDKLIFAFLKENSLDERAKGLLGNDTDGYLYEISDKKADMSLHAFVCAPMMTRRDRRSMHVFVNNRIIKDTKILGAIKASYRTLLEVSCHPIVALKLTVSSDTVDVNVHPRKAEVRFKDERHILSYIIRVISGYLQTTPWLKKDYKSDVLCLSPNFEKESGMGDITTFHQILKKDETNENSLYAPSLSSENKVANEIDDAKPIDNQNKLLSAHNFSDLRIIGQVKTTYLLLEGDEGLVVVDQHAAHERVVFEKIRKKLKKTKASSPFLVPVKINLSTHEFATFTHWADTLRQMGIECEEFSNTSIVVRAVPDFLRKENIERFILDIISDLCEHNRSDSFDNIYTHLCATLACHSSIRAGQKLAHEEIKALLKELDGTDFGAHCPHGRPIVKSFSAYKMKLWFDRT